MNAALRHSTPRLSDSPPDADDYIARWFVANHRTGDYMGIRFGRIAAASAEPEWSYMPHWLYDGVGGFAELLRERGVTNLSPLPEMKDPARPSFWQELKAVRRLLKRVQNTKSWYLPATTWRKQGGERQHGNNTVGYSLLSREATAVLKHKARERDVSLNSLLLWSLDRLARQTWLPRTAYTIDWSTQQTQWMIPVNMRGGIILRRDTANHLGLMDVLLPASAHPVKVHAQIRQELQQCSHWAAWRMMRLSRYMSRRTVEALTQKEALRGVVHTGVFSNLGDWPAAVSSPEGEAAWLFCPQTTRKTPVAAGAVCWAGRLGLALQLHPMFEVSKEIVSGWTNRWVALSQETP